MRSNRDYRDYLYDIVEAARKAERFTEGMDYEAFVANDEKVYAVAHA